MRRRLIKLPFRLLRAFVRYARDAASPPPDPSGEHNAAPAATPAPESPSRPAPTAIPSGTSDARRPTAPVEVAVEIDVDVEETPNPNALKFTCSVPTTSKGTLSFQTAESAEGHPLGAALFQIAGVRTVFAARDFVTITREAGASWDTIVPATERALKSVLRA